MVDEKKELNLIEDQTKRMAETINTLRKVEGEKNAQPFITNDLLDTLIREQPRKWVHYLILICSFLALLIGSVALLHSYALI